MHKRTIRRSQSQCDDAHLRMSHLIPVCGSPDGSCISSQRACWALGPTDNTNRTSSANRVTSAANRMASALELRPKHKNVIKIIIVSKAVQFKSNNLLSSSACYIILRTHADDAMNHWDAGMPMSFKWVWRNWYVIKYCKCYSSIGSWFVCVRRAMDALGNFLSTREARIALRYRHAWLLRFAGA